MPRRPRGRSATGIHHVISRGVGKQIIFEDSSDRYHYLDLLKQILLEEGAELLAWCLMSNHTHLIIHAPDHLSEVMKRINTSYAGFFNRKYHRQGHLFQGRFRSEPIEDEIYLLTVVKYIHLNPVKAGFGRPQDYAWSSYHEYIEGGRYCNTEMLRNLFDSMDAFVRFHEAQDESPGQASCAVERLAVPDEVALQMIRQELGENVLVELRMADRQQRNRIIRNIRNLGIAAKQIERITGISYHIIRRC